MPVQLVSAIKKPIDITETLHSDEGLAASPPQRTIGELLRDKRIALGISLATASRKTGIPEQALQAIEAMQLNLFINQGAKLERHIHIYAKRLGQSLIGHEALVDKAKHAIRPKEVTQDLLDLIRGTP